LIEINITMNRIIFRSILTITFLGLLSLPPAKAFQSRLATSSFSAVSSSKIRTSLHIKHINNEDYATEHIQDSSISIPSRRDALSTAAATAVALFCSPVLPAIAADGDAVSASAILLRLRGIPTFCIVNADGVPFMIFDGQASATGYFFLSFQVAAATLSDARQKDTKGEDIWGGASIISVPLAIALQLTLRNTQRKALNNGILFSTFNDIVASEEAVADAQSVDSKNPDRWAQKGRVPLFYMDGLVLENKKSPQYFNKQDLTTEWANQNPGKPEPKIQIVEMVDLFRNSIRKNDLGQLDTLQLMPVVESSKVAADLRSKQTPPNYSFKETVLVGTAKG
jgi:hypothetical protein